MTPTAALVTSVVLVIVAAGALLVALCLTWMAHDVLRHAERVAIRAEGDDATDDEDDPYAFLDEEDLDQPSTPRRAAPAVPNYPPAGSHLPTKPCAHIWEVRRDNLGGYYTKCTKCHADSVEGSPCYSAAAPKISWFGADGKRKG